MKVNRIAKIASIFVEEGLGYLTGLDNPSTAHEIADIEKARRLRRTFERLGPTFVKFGQMLANRIDLFSDDFIKELSLLHANVPPFDSKIAFEIIDSELGGRIDEFFSKISESPVASASIAQVYRATLKSNGKEVAIKVQRPHLDQTLLEDLELIIQMSGWLDTLVPSYRKSMMHIVAKEYAASARAEMNFLGEASALQEFEDIFQNDPYFEFPAVYLELCSARVIVMEWFNGPRVGQVQTIGDLETLGYKGSEFVRNLLRIQVSMSYEHGLIHGDMHPGNLILIGHGKVGIIDCGLHARVPKKTRELVLNMLLMQSQGRTTEQVDIALELSPPADLSDLAKFRQELVEHYSKPRKKSSTSVSADLIATMRIGTKYRNNANPYLLMIVRNLLILEGMFLKFDPDFDPHDHIGQNIKGILSKRFTPDDMIKTFSPVMGELAIALHNRPALLSRLLRLESKFVESPTLGDFLRREGVIGSDTATDRKWLYLVTGTLAGVLMTLLTLLLSRGGYGG